MKKEEMLFIDNLKELGVEIDSKQLEQFNQYYETLVEWNEFMNLTGITEYDEVLLKHFVDSLVLDPNKLITSDKIKLIDVGTGAGFPGLPIKIAFPNVDVVLLDSLNKRIKFLDEVINKLGLENIKTIHSRAEDGGRNKELREQFDIAISRAVANLSSLAEYNLPYVKLGGYFVAMKSGEIDEEAENAKKAIKLLGGQLEKITKFRLPNTDIDRSLVLIKKVKETSKKYPRKAGLPTKEPLS
ncbi:16S rRNA (guanine(527)-N(7))-methyltransferase RsmG [Lachnospira multipara]|uniref:Ribosomal RNA small subunit methyltransferase G n=1 Tax=Lachnospira multipara TaxID=28051 RepID=A0A1H5U750_9FIRM|nr:16S rRNA (guanine(527)-N(7))-methyltransferase RsmG [Lachnospira multipara]MBQ2473170.1 16S rRNA (guanine(527)-N(7))-methyltransferase RsmG [Lachnospira sp.]SEF70932.1 16S rRNA m(7)G-527 methyltransferase [Lachnospira multipara]